jgi:hypothetical protein
MSTVVPVPATTEQLLAMPEGGIDRDLIRGQLRPEVDFDSLRVYHKYLAGSLSFPFEAAYAHKTGPFQTTTRHLTVIALGEAAEPWVDDMYGLICRAREERRRVDAPLCDLELTKRGPNRRLIADYSYWFSNFR